MVLSSPIQFISSSTDPSAPGTYIVEFEAGQKLLNEMLHSEETVQKAIDKLVIIAKTCQFEGWLVNIECQVAPTKIPLLL